MKWQPVAPAHYHHGPSVQCILHCGPITLVCDPNALSCVLPFIFADFIGNNWMCRFIFKHLCSIVVYHAKVYSALQSLPWHRINVLISLLSTAVQTLLSATQSAGTCSHLYLFSSDSTKSTFSKSNLDYKTVPFLLV